MNFEDRVEQLKDIVATYFTYNHDGVFVDKLPRNRRTGVRLAKVKFASYDTDCEASREEACDLMKQTIFDTELQITSVNSFRSHALLQKKTYDSIIVHMVIDKY